MTDHRSGSRGTRIGDGSLWINRSASNHCLSVFCVTIHYHLYEVVAQAQQLPTCHCVCPSWAKTGGVSVPNPLYRTVGQSRVGGGGGGQYKKHNFSWLRCSSKANSGNCLVWREPLLLFKIQQRRDVDPMLIQCWATVFDGGATLNQPWSTSCSCWVAFSHCTANSYVLCC